MFPPHKDGCSYFDFDNQLSCDCGIWDYLRSRVHSRDGLQTDPEISMCKLFNVKISDSLGDITCNFCKDILFPNTID